MSIYSMLMLVYNTRGPQLYDTLRKCLQCHTREKYRLTSVCLQRKGVFAVGIMIRRVRYTEERLMCWLSLLVA